MPVTKPATLTYQVDHINIDASNGATTVSVAVILDGPEPKRVDSIVHPLSPEDCGPIWQAKAAAGKTRWADLREQLYTLLQARGVIPV